MRRATRRKKRSQMYNREQRCIRPHGYGRLLNKYLVELARNERCTSIQLDSAVHRGDAHRFYFRHRMRITSYHFARPLD